MVQAQFMQYVGPLERGSIIVKQLKASDPNRKLNYRKGQVWEVGVDLPERVCRFVNKSFPKFFEIVDKDVENEIAFKKMLSIMLKNFSDSTKDEILKWTNEVLNKSEDFEELERQPKERKKVVAKSRKKITT